MPQGGPGRILSLVGPRIAYLSSMLYELQDVLDRDVHEDEHEHGPWTVNPPDSATVKAPSAPRCFVAAVPQGIPLRNDENHVCAKSAQPRRVPVGRSVFGTASGRRTRPHQRM